MKTKKEQNKDELLAVAQLSRKSLGQRSVEDGRWGAFNDEELVFHRETPPEADTHTESAMEKRSRGALRSYKTGRP